MRVLLSPIVYDGVQSNFSFSGEVITVEINGKKDVFDFSGMPDGRIEGVDTDLLYDPIVSAERVNGALKVELLNAISSNATYEERFPEWKDV